MDSLRDFIEGYCVKTPGTRIETSYLYVKFKEFLAGEHIVDSTLSPTIFTRKLRKLLEKANNIPGDNSVELEFVRQAKGVTIIGLTVGSDYEEDLKLYKEECKEKAKVYNAVHYGRNKEKIKNKRQTKNTATQNIVDTDRASHDTRMIGLIRSMFDEHSKNFQKTSETVDSLGPIDAKESIVVPKESTVDVPKESTPVKSELSLIESLAMRKSNVVDTLGSTTKNGNTVKKVNFNLEIGKDTARSVVSNYTIPDEKPRYIAKICPPSTKNVVNR